MNISLLELNEINFDLVQNYIDAGVALDNLGALNNQEVLVFSSEDGGNIDPWIQWPSVHTGKTYNEHQVFRLGDAVNYQ
jgi:hypothetical protein